MTGAGGQKLSALEQWYQRTETERLNRDYDSAFAELPEHYKAEFGEGSIGDFASDAKELAARKAIVLEAVELQQLDAESGRPQMPVSKLVKRVLAARDFDKQYEQGRQDAAEHMGRRKRQGLARPTQRRSEAFSDDQRARANLRQRMARQGHSSAPANKEVDSWFGS